MSVIIHLVVMAVLTVVAALGGALTVVKPYPSRLGFMGLLALMCGGIGVLLVGCNMFL